jgi:hydrogenase maturation protease
MPKRTLILGLGNPILGDDGIGWRVVEMVQPFLTDAALEADCLAVGGLSLMERLTGYDRAVLVDAIKTGKQPAGSVSVFTLSDLPDLQAGHLSSAHDTSLQKALQVGRLSGAHLPEEIFIVTVEVRQVCDFSEQLSPELQTALPLAVRQVMEILRQGVDFPNS